MPITHSDAQAWLQHIRSLIAKDQLNEVLKLLQTLFQGNPHLDEIIQQSARFHAIRQQIRQGIVGHKEATLTQNQIRFSLIELLNELESPVDSPELGQAFERAMGGGDSKNVVHNSNIKAGGNVHIGDKQITQNAEKIYNFDHVDKADFS